MSDWSCTRVKIHNKIHSISTGCPRPSIALEVQNCGLKHQSFVCNWSKVSAEPMGIIWTIYTLLNCGFLYVTGCWWRLPVSLPSSTTWSTRSPSPPHSWYRGSPTSCKNIHSPGESLAGNAATTVDSHYCNSGDSLETFIIPGCRWPSIALQCRFVGLNTIHWL